MKRTLFAATAVAAGLTVAPVVTASTASAATRTKTGADLRAKVSAPKTVKRGQRITYTLRAGNHGPKTAHATVFGGTLPKGLTKVRFHAPGCDLRGRQFVCYTGKAKNGETGTFRVSAKVSRKAPKTLKADLGVASLETRDPKPKNNGRVVTTRVRG